MTLFQLITAAQAAYAEHGDIEVGLLNNQGDLVSPAWTVSVLECHDIRPRGLPLETPSPMAFVLDKQR